MLNRYRSLAALLSILCCFFATSLVEATESTQMPPQQQKVATQRQTHH